MDIGVFNLCMDSMKKNIKRLDRRISELKKTITSDGWNSLKEKNKIELRRQIRYVILEMLFETNKDAELLKEYKKLKNGI